MKRMRSKRMLAAMLAVLMCITLILSSCGGENEPEDSDVKTDNSITVSQSSAPLQTDNSSLPSSDSQNSSSPDDENDNVKPPKVDVTTEWRGKTLNILATTWESGEATAPWAQPELNGGGFGEIIDGAIAQRNMQIAEKYGVTLNWINARSSQIVSLLAEADAVGSQRYHIAMPRVTEAQDLVENNLVYDLANREYIDLTKSYYSQAAKEAYTVNNRTLFVSGDFSYLDKASSHVTFYNAAILDVLHIISDPYELVQSGNWTVGEMMGIASLVSKNNSEAQWTDNDVYGFGTQGIVQFYGYGGIRQVSVENSKYELFKSSLNFNAVVEAIMGIKGATYTRTEWENDPLTAFREGRLLFYNAPLQRIDYFENQNEEFKVGILPNPKMSEGQDKYYTLVGEEAVLMCVPKSTEDRVMSDAFVEILSQTGSEFLKDAYLEKIKTNIDPQLAEQSAQILTDYVFDGMIYDQGYLYGVYTQVFKNICSGYSGMVPDNTELTETALTTVSLWNMSWLDYAE